MSDEMTRLDEITARLEERPAAEAEFIAFGRQWREVYGTHEVVPFPPNFSIAVQYASDLSRARHDLAALLAVVREVAALVAPQWRSIEYDRNALIDDIRTVLATLTETEETNDEG